MSEASPQIVCETASVADRELSPQVAGCDLLPEKRAAFAAAYGAEVALGLGRIVALHHRSFMFLKRHIHSTIHLHSLTYSVYLYF